MILYYFKKVSVSVSLEFLLGNRWKYYARGKVLLLFFKCLGILMKHVAQVFWKSSPRAPQE